MPRSATPPDPEPTVDAATQQIGRALWGQLSRRTPSIFERRWWDDRILQWAMADESVKVQMFRFVDVLPMLRTREAVMQHLQEYFEEVREKLPWAVRLGLDVSQPEGVLGRAVAVNARSNAMRMARRFIAGSTVDEVFQTVARLRKQGLAFTLDLLGEATTSERDAEHYQQAYLRLIGGLSTAVEQWPRNELLDDSPYGPVPRVNVSIKLSALYSQFDPIDPAGTAEAVKARLRPILRCAREHDAYVHFDMEHYAFKDLTLEIFQQVLLEDQFRDWADTGIVIQAYLPEAQRDLARLREWAERRGAPVWVRLVKGAYWDFETVIAAARGWPVPVFQQKWQSDDNFERQTRFLLENARWLRPAFGSHNLRSLSHAMAWAQELRVPPGGFEIQMLYGMGADQAQLFAERGQRVRIYTPFGELIPGMAYLVRRLLENTSNDSFLRASFASGVSVEDLLMKPAVKGAKAKPPAPLPLPEFQNEPHTDFARAENRTAMQHALDEVAGSLGGEYALVINGKKYETRGKIVSVDPSSRAQVVGRVASAAPEDAERAIEAARNAFPAWSRTEPQYRSEYLELIAAEMRSRRFELAAWEVFECGKPWAEADADVAEAIDFCMYYAAQMRRLASPQRRDLPGEENAYSYRPRGVAVVIAPWNFPLAILTGMTTAALATGNTVVIKPAEQSSVIGAKFMETLLDAGIPAGVVNFLPGVGEEIGPTLTESPEIDLIAFTGSRTVGLSIHQHAAVTDPRQRMVKHVIAEMGGKNAIIVDDDADLDEAVLGVVKSAFGYAGQKCSACSRVIVLRGIYEDFLKRLVEATRSLRVGPAVNPGTFVGPVIDGDARERILEYIAIGKQEARLVLESPAGDLEDDGFFVGPHIFADVNPRSRLAQEEIFGPVLAVIPAADFDEALRIANGTSYALTGGVFSRSPVHLRRARDEFAVGNLYLNRGITGALVDKQPFGGYRMSGIGTKAGGPDYLLQFVIPVNVTENTLRRGFAPPPEEGE